MTAEEWIDRNILFDSRLEQPATMKGIMQLMSQDGIEMAGTKRQQQMKIAQILHRKGARKERVRSGAIWHGISRAPR